MNTRRRSYILEDNEKTFIYEEFYDENRNIIKTSDHRENPPAEEYFKYNAKGLLIHQIDIQNGIENSSQSFEYDENDAIIDVKTFIGGDLCEHMHCSRTPTGFIQILTQDGEEFERMEKIEQGDNWSSRLYRYGELIESQEYVYDPSSKTGFTSIKNTEEHTTFFIREKYNADDKLIFTEEFNEDETLLQSTEILIDNASTYKELIHDYTNGKSIYENLYEFDKSENITYFEARSLSGDLLSFHKRSYNSDNWLIEETGVTNKNHYGIFGIHDQYKGFHIIHEYENI